MKITKVLASLVALVTLLVVVSPISADPPGNNQDPFGGFSISGSALDAVGAAARFGLTPGGGTALPGGKPSTLSGDGTSPRKAIYIGGEGTDPDTGERGSEFPNCGTIRIPAGSARWFKLDSESGNRTRIWLDDELDDEDEPSGFAVFGAAYQYMVGTAPGDAWQTNVYKDASGLLDGFVMAIFGANNLKPNHAFNPPNAAILTLDVDKAGMLKRGPGNQSLAEITGAGITGYAKFNPQIKNHLLWYESEFGGWVFVMVYDQMIWDGTVSVCSMQLEVIKVEDEEGE